MRMFITSENKYLPNDMKIFGTYSIPLISVMVSFLTHLHEPITKLKVNSKFTFFHQLLCGSQWLGCLVQFLKNFH